jgi:hypothetical protein
MDMGLAISAFEADQEPGAGVYGGAGGRRLLVRTSRTPVILSPLFSAWKGGGAAQAAGVESRKSLRFMFPPGFL